MKTVRHPTAGRVVNTGAQSRWGRWQTAELGLIFAPQSLLGGAHIHEMWSNPLIRKGFSDLKQKSRKNLYKAHDINSLLQISCRRSFYEQEKNV